MTAGEGVKMGLAGSSPASLDDFIITLGLDPDNKSFSKVSWSENIVRFLTHPIVSGLLLTFGVLGIFFELQMPGWGISGMFGASCLILFFGGHYLAGLASSVDVLLFVLGVGLIALELLVIPGFGVAGIAGMACVMVGIYLALVDRPIPKFSWDYQILNSALFTFIFMICTTSLGIFVIWKLSPESRIKELMVLSASEDAKRGFTASESLEAMIGQYGRSLTHLRPTGRARFAGDPIEVQTEGGFIEKDRPLKVIRVVGNKVFVVEEEKSEAS
jgi:membrane-bound serine protease (ClpP class)